MPYTVKTGCNWFSAACVTVSEKIKQVSTWNMIKQDKSISPLITVIVPVYRAEQYLADCVSSILRQSFREFELLLVDDGSPDACPALCDHFAGEDVRVTVIHKANGGVSSARNAGLARASGEYVVFVDSDDYLGPDYLQELYALRQSADPEVEVLVISDYQPFSLQGAVSRTFPPAFSVSLPGDKPNPEVYRHLVFDFRIFPPYCKLYHRRVIEAHTLRFREDLRTAEDFDFNCRYLQYVSQIIYTPSVHYHYRVDYKTYHPSNDGVLGQSEIRSAHLMVHGLLELAQYMNVPKILPEIWLWAANKHYFNRLEMLFVPNRRIGFRTRRRLYRALTSDTCYRDAYRRGVRALPASGTKWLAQAADCFPAWWLLYKVRQLRGVQNKYQ